MENKKLFHNKKFIIAISIIAVIMLIAFMVIITRIIINRNYGEIDWNNLVLGEYLPKPEKNYGKIDVDREDMLSIKIPKITQQEFKDYTNKCINEGYNLDIDNGYNGDSYFKAFDEEGYNIEVRYSRKSMDITLKSPEKMEELEWPTTGLGSMLPKPKSNYGSILWDNSDTFLVHIGNTTIEEFNEYVKECQNNGYIDDYSKGEKTFIAKNSEGYDLSVSYIGGNRISISIDAPEGQESTNTTSQTENAETPEENVSNSTDNIAENNTETVNSSTENNAETVNPSTENTTVETNTDDYSADIYRDDAEDTFLAEVRDSCPYGVKIHTITGWLAKTYEGDGIWFFKVNITENNAFGAEIDEVAEGRVDAKNGNNITYFYIY